MLGHHLTHEIGPFLSIEQIIYPSSHELGTKMKLLIVIRRLKSI